MAPSQWTRVQSIFDAASEIPAESRSDYLESACGGDVELRREVDSLLAAMGTSTGLIADSVRTQVERAFYDVGGLEPGSMVGAYRLIRKLGEGGMAAVYLAARADHQFERQVAIKFTRPELGAGELSERFLQERRILAGLEHPCIARMLDGGLSGAVPYLVMEFVDGVPIDHYCREQHLTVRQIVELLRSVCSAVEYAHRHLVVHRDVKPSNILVGHDGTPKLLDFGIAKLLKDSAAAEDLTRPTHRFMTMEYASPEQVMGKPITTATDVYSLGLVLYELVTGHRPFRMGDLTLLEIQERICRTDPPRPSSIATDQSAAQSLRGDLDSIILMALRKEPRDRYGSVQQMLEDLEAWANGFPVTASKGNARYRTLKFIRRHRVGVTVAGLFVLLLAGSSIAMATLALRLARERNTALAERQRATQVSEFMRDLFAAADPYRVPGKEVTVRQLLDEGWKRVEQNASLQPGVLAGVLEAMAEAYQRLGDEARAQQLFSGAVEALKKSDGPASAAVAHALRQLSDVERTRGDLSGAETHLRQVLEIQKGLLPPTHVELSHTLNDLGLVLQAHGKVPEARDLFERSIAISTLYPAQRAQTLTMMSNLGGALSELGDLDGSEKVFRDVLVQRQELLGKAHPQVARTLNRLARTLELKGALVESEQHYATAADVYLRSVRADYPDRLVALNNRGRVLQELRRYADAEACYRESIEAGARTLGDHIDVASWESNYATLLAERGETAAAAALFQKSLATFRGKLGDGSRREAQTLLGTGALYTRTGEDAKAEHDLLRAAGIFRQTMGEADPRLADPLYLLAMLRRGQRRLDEAVVLARQALDIDRRWPDTGGTASHLLGLSAILLEQKEGAAAELPARQALAIRQRLFGEGAWQIAEARTQVLAARKLQGLADER